MMVKIGMREYTIMYDDLEADNDRRGCTYPQKGIIRIDPNLPDALKQITIFHEIMHAVADYVGIDSDEKYTEEEFITHIAPTLLQTIKENNLFVMVKNNYILQAK